MWRIAPLVRYSSSPPLFILSSSPPSFQRGVLDTQLQTDLSESSLSCDSFLHDFFVTMAICNTVVVSHRASAQDRGTHNQQHWNRFGIQYEYESPDENALVEAAKAYGYVLLSRTPSAIKVQTPQGVSMEYELLHLLEFSPERKCMSVVVRERGGRERVMLFTKGADSSVLSSLAEEGEVAMETQRQLNVYACLGLRTLCLARRVSAAVL